jgi:hypothetical protein
VHLKTLMHNHKRQFLGFRLPPRSPSLLCAEAVRASVHTHTTISEAFISIEVFPRCRLAKFKRSGENMYVDASRRPKYDGPAKESQLPYTRHRYGFAGSRPSSASLQYLPLHHFSSNSNTGPHAARRRPSSTAIGTVRGALFRVYAAPPPLHTPLL